MLKILNGFVKAIDLKMELLKLSILIGNVKFIVHLWELLISNVIETAINHMWKISIICES